MVGQAPGGYSHRAVYLVAGDARVVGGAQHACVLRDDGARGAGAALRGRASAALPRGVARRPRAGAPPAARAVRAGRAGRARLRAPAARSSAQGTPPIAHQQAHPLFAFGNRKSNDVASFALQPTLRCAPNR